MCGKATRSIPADESPLTITLERAQQLFAEPKQRGRGTRQQPTALKEFGTHPSSGAELKLFDGRYGPYISDGSVYATVPKDENPDQLTLERAVELIDAKAARGGGKKKRSAKKTAAKKAPAKKKKAAAKKKAAKKTED
jgi:DNA topoisomerase-1